MEFITKLMGSFGTSGDAYLFMWAILTTGVFAFTIIIERFIYLRARVESKPEQFIKEILGLIKKDKIDEAISICNKKGSRSLAVVVKAGLEESTLGADRVRNAIDEAMLREVPLLEKRTGFLAVIGNVATLLGLLGTVYGLIMSFAAVGKPGIDAAKKSELLAQGIAAAMNSTFSGLTVAITAIMLFAYYKAKTQQIVDELDEYGLRIGNILVERSYKTHKYNISADQLKESVGVHITHNNVKLFTDNKLIKEINI